MTCSRCSRPWAHLHVTDVLRRAGLLDVSWATSEAMLRGTYVHQAIALGSDLDETSLDPAWSGYWRAWDRWRVESGADIERSEAPIEDRALGYCGTLDAIARVNGVRYVLDYKSGTMPASVGPQTAAYRRALPVEDRPIRRACVELHGDGTYHWIELSDRADERIFLAALEVVSWQMTHL